MRFYLPILLISLSLLSPITVLANALICETNGECNEDTSGTGSAPSALPSRGSVTRLNPSAIPIERGLGIETIYYGGSFDFNLVKGLGRVGAALSPSNSEQTFFGPPGFELPENFLARNQAQQKYRSSKFTLGTAMNLYDNKQHGWKRFELNLGGMLKYNSDLNSLSPGIGFSGVAGPFTYGYSVYNDQTRLDYSIYGLTTKPIVDYLVETYSLGLFIDNFVIDYSLMREISDTVSTVSVVTASAVVKRFILIAAYRSENSDRPAYDFASRTLVNQQIKIAEFGGVQFHLSEALMLGVFYNYYLVREFSAGLTLFF